MSAMALAQEQSAVDVHKLAFLSGCWQAKFGAVEIEEQWLRPAGGSMVGVGRVVRGGKTVNIEFLTIREQDGVLTYTAKVTANKEPVPFRMTKLSASEVVFENPAHDFPQRILYRREANGGLFASVSGTQNGKARAEEIPFQRARCGE